MIWIVKMFKINWTKYKINNKYIEIMLKLKKLI